MAPDSHPVITINKNLITEDMKQLFIFTATILACMGDEGAGNSALTPCFAR